MTKWQEAVNKISDYILESASEGGVMGWALEQVSGVNMQEEAARGKRLEAERRAKGMKPDESLIVDSTQYQDPSLQALKDKVKAAGDAANAMMETATDATGQALEDATTGQSAAASEAVKALQAELASLREQASGKVAAMNAGAAESGDRMAGIGGTGGSLGKASAASFSLAALSMSSGRGNFEQNQLSATKKIADKAAEQVEKLDNLVVAVQNWSLHHA